MCQTLGCSNDRLPDAVLCSECREKKRRYSRSVKQKVLDHYGQVCNCPCGCKVTRFEWLTIDHVNSDGKEQRQQHGVGSGFYGWIIRNGFPTDLQVLCWNCNAAKEFFGGCA